VRHAIKRSNLSVRYGDGSIFITTPVLNLVSRISRAEEIEFQIDAARVMGWFSEGNRLDEASRKSLALAWRNCI
jgi:hypothetical protein